MRMLGAAASAAAMFLAAPAALAQEWTPFGFNDATYGALHVTTTDAHLYAAIFSDAGSVGHGIWRRDIRVADAPWELVGLDGDILSQLLVRPASDGLDTLVALSETTYHPGPSPLVQRSFDGGATWTPADQGLESATRAYVLRAYPFDPDVLQIVAGSDGVFYRTTNFGERWNQIPEPLNAQDLAFSPLDEGIAHTTIYSGFFQSAIGRSADAGVTWELDKEGKGAGGRLCYGGDGWLYRARGSRMLRLPYGSTEWDTVGVHPEGRNLWDLFVAPWDPSTVVTSAYSGPELFLSSDHGATWSEIPSPLGNDYVLSSAGGTAQPGVVYVSTWESGLWRLELPGAVGVEGDTTAGAVVHPGAHVRVGENPAGGRLRLSFELPRSADARPMSAASLAIYDVAGRLVRTWSIGGVSGEVVWDGRANDGHAAPPGRYFVEIRRGATRAAEPFVWLGR